MNARLVVPIITLAIGIGAGASVASSEPDTVAVPGPTKYVHDEVEVVTTETVTVTAPNTRCDRLIDSTQRIIDATSEVSRAQGDFRVFLTNAAAWTIGATSMELNAVRTDLNNIDGRLALAYDKLGAAKNDFATYQAECQTGS